MLAGTLLTYSLYILCGDMIEIFKIIRGVYDSEASPVMSKDQLGDISIREQKPAADNYFLLKELLSL